MLRVRATRLRASSEQENANEDGACGESKQSPSAFDVAHEVFDRPVAWRVRAGLVAVVDRP